MKDYKTKLAESIDMIKVFLVVSYMSMIMGSDAVNMIESLLGRFGSKVGKFLVVDVLEVVEDCIKEVVNTWVEEVYVWDSTDRLSYTMGAKLRVYRSGKIDYIYGLNLPEQEESEEYVDIDLLENEPATCNIANWPYGADPRHEDNEVFISECCFDTKDEVEIQRRIAEKDRELFEQETTGRLNIITTSYYHELRFKTIEEVLEEIADIDWVDED